MSLLAVWTVTVWLEDFVMTHLLPVASTARSQLLTLPPWTSSHPVMSSPSTTATWWPKMATMCTATQARCTPWLSRARPSSICWVTEVTAETRPGLTDSDKNLPRYLVLFRLLSYLKALRGWCPRPPPRLISKGIWIATSTACCSTGHSPSGPADPGPALTPTHQRAS